MGSKTVTARLGSKRVEPVLMAARARARTAVRLAGETPGHLASEEARSV
jgi:hypothetical protein